MPPEHMSPETVAASWGFLENSAKVLRLSGGNCWHPSACRRPHLRGHLLPLWEGVAWARRHFPVHFEERLIWFHEEAVTLSLPHLAQLMDSKCNSVKCNVSAFLEEPFPHFIITFKQFLSFDLVDPGGQIIPYCGAAPSGGLAPTHAVPAGNLSRRRLLSSERQSSRRPGPLKSSQIPSVELGRLISRWCGRGLGRGHPCSGAGVRMAAALGSAGAELDGCVFVTKSLGFLENDDRHSCP